MLYILTGFLLSLGIYANFSKICLAMLHVYVFFENMYKEASEIKKITYYDYYTLQPVSCPGNSKMIAFVQKKNKKKYIECSHQLDISKINMKTDFCFACAEIEITSDKNIYDVYDILNSYVPESDTYVFNSKFTEVCVFLKTGKIVSCDNEEFFWSIITDEGDMKKGCTLQYDIKSKILEYKE